MNLVAKITLQYLLSVRDISGVLFVFGGLSSTFTSVRGGSLDILGFVTLPIEWNKLMIVLLHIGYIVVTLVA